MPWDMISIWIQIILTLIILSFLYRDNPLYKFAEHLFVGVATAYYIIQQYDSSFKDNLWTPFTNILLHSDQVASATAATWDRLLIIPFVLGLMFFFKFFKSTAWLARWPMAVVIGTYAGLAVIGFAQGDLVGQIRANMVPFLRAGSWSDFTSDPSWIHFYQLVWNPILVIGVLSSLVYFFFSKAHTGVTGRVATLGIWFLMVSFGASYGATVMTRISLFVERANLMIVEHSGPTVVCTLLIVVYLALWRMRLPKDGEPSA